MIVQTSFAISRKATVKIILMRAHEFPLFPDETPGTAHIESINRKTWISLPEHKQTLSGGKFSLYSLMAAIFLRCLGGGPVPRGLLRSFARLCSNETRPVHNGHPWLNHSHSFHVGLIPRSRFSQRFCSCRVSTDTGIDGDLFTYPKWDVEYPPVRAGVYAKGLIKKGVNEKTQRVVLRDIPNN